MRRCPTAQYAWCIRASTRHHWLSPSKTNNTNAPPSRRLSSPPTRSPIPSTPALDAVLHLPPQSAYLHIPFCRARCWYCDFAVVTGRQAVDGSVHERYVATLVAEIASTAAAVVARTGKPPDQLNTVYFGGGTPSLLAPRHVGEVLMALDSHIGIAATAEVTLEMDPGTFDSETLEAWRGLGVNRASVGVQTFDDAALALCNRQHSAAEAREALGIVAASGLASWSLDLIHSLPDQTLAGWRSTLEEAAAFSPPHVSVYALGIEPNTRFARLYTPDTAPLPDEAASAGLFLETMNLLPTFGLTQYELMSYAQGDEHRSRHNLNYWAHRPWYGFGLSAASFSFGKTATRPRTVGAWRDFVAKGSSGIAEATFLPDKSGSEGGRGEVDPAWQAEAVQDMVVLGLRRLSGMDLRDVCDIGGPAAAAAVLEACQAAGPDFVAVEPGDCAAEPNGWPRIRLTQPDGILRENLVVDRIVSLL